jgi:hypothetical protein
MTPPVMDAEKEPPPLDGSVNKLERRILQLAIAMGSLVPIGAGAAGVLLGPRMMAPVAVFGDLDSHFRYLSGLLLAIGLGFASTIPRIELHGHRFRMLTGIVVVGGMGRLISLLMLGPASWTTTAALVMELIVTPALAGWGHRVESRSRNLGVEKATLT